MKRILEPVLLLALFFFSVSCVKNETEEVVYLDVTANNLAGDWRLESMNGTPADGAVSVYVRFIRKDSRYELYSNVGSMEYTRKSGSFVILQDELSGYILKGDYDFTLGEQWNHDYVVLLTEDHMTWTAVDDKDDVCVYVRCTIPEEITSLFPSLGD